MVNVLVTVKLGSAQASMAEAARHLSVSETDLDPDFGVVLIDPENLTYAVMVDERVAGDAAGAEGAAGPFSNPRIEPTGPPEA